MELTQSAHVQTSWSTVHSALRDNFAGSDLDVSPQHLRVLADICPALLSLGSAATPLASFAEREALRRSQSAEAPGSGSAMPDTNALNSGTHQTGAEEMAPIQAPGAPLVDAQERDGSSHATAITDQAAGGFFPDTPPEGLRRFGHQVPVDTAIAEDFAIQVHAPLRHSTAAPQRPSQQRTRGQSDSEGEISGSTDNAPRATSEAAVSATAEAAELGDKGAGSRGRSARRTRSTSAHKACDSELPSRQRAKSARGACGKAAKPALRQDISTATAPEDGKGARTRQRKQTATASSAAAAVAASRAAAANADGAERKQHRKRPDQSQAAAPVGAQARTAEKRERACRRHLAQALLLLQASWLSHAPSAAQQDPSPAGQPAHPRKQEAHGHDAAWRSADALEAVLNSALPVRPLPAPPRLPPLRAQPFGGNTAAFSPQIPCPGFAFVDGAMPPPVGDQGTCPGLAFVETAVPLCASDVAQQDRAAGECDTEAALRLPSEAPVARSDVLDRSTAEGEGSTGGSPKLPGIETVSGGVWSAGFPLEAITLADLARAARILSAHWQRGKQPGASLQTCGMQKPDVLHAAPCLACCG